jgi:hypothetical protein
VDPDRLRALSEAKAAALVRDHFGDAPRESIPIAGGAALRDATTAWVYVAGDPRRTLGRSLAVAARHGLADLHVLIEEDGGPLARRAAALSPPVGVWRIDGRDLRAAVPEPLPAPVDPPVGSERFIAMLEAAGVEVVVEHGEVLGEVRGLEVARIRMSGETGGLVLEVGVGRFDQEATAVIHGHLPTDEALGRAVELIRSHRRSGARPHPVNRLARDRWLRSQLLDDPTPVGLEALTAVAPPLPRLNLKDAHPAPAIGRDADGRPVLVVCSVGVDLELIPVTADLIAREAPARVVFAVPARDQVPVQRDLATRLAVPVEFVTVEGDWPD